MRIFFYLGAIVTLRNMSSFIFFFLSLFTRFVPFNNRISQYVSVFRLRLLLLTFSFVLSSFLTSAVSILLLVFLVGVFLLVSYLKPFNFFCESVPIITGTSPYRLTLALFHYLLNFPPSSFVVCYLLRFPFLNDYTTNFLFQFCNYVLFNNIAKILSNFFVSTIRGMLS